MKSFARLSVVFLFAFALSACTSTDDSPQASIGNSSAPVLVEEFSDFECPACALISPELETVIKRNPDIAQLKYYHFPLPQHTRAFPVAEAAECAGDQGKFWEYADLLFKNQKNLQDDNLKQYAATLSLNEKAFNDCFDSHQKRGKVKANLYEGRRRQVDRTPSIFVNGQLVQWSGTETFEAYLKSL